MRKDFELMYPLTKTLGLSVVIALLNVVPAKADISAKFDEGAPKDRFTFTNIGDCSIVDATLLLDLSGSKSGLVFDVTDKGAGVEVFQPFELVAGKEVITKQPKVSDGETKIELSISKLAPQRSVAFTIDVDDTTGNREITVSDSEMRGTTIKLTLANKTYRSAFSDASNATLKIPNC